MLLIDCLKNRRLAMTKSKRRIIMINRKFQLKLIVKLILVNIILMVGFSIIMYTFFNSEIETQLSRAHITFKNVQNMLVPIIVIMSTLNVIVASLIISIFVMFASFRIAGPLYRFNEVLKQLGKKNLKPIIKLRANDQLYECSKILKSTIDILAKDMKSIKKNISNLNNKIEKKATIKDLKPHIDKLNKIIDQYKI
jgi:methyl-accepting chemotaxis protein